MRIPLDASIPVYLHVQIDFWDNIYGLNMRVIKEIALTEPLVDQVESKAVCTNAVPILQLDILTCTKAVSCDLMYPY